jgi:hypothetical protein
MKIYILNIYPSFLIQICLSCLIKHSSFIENEKESVYFLSN